MRLPAGTGLAARQALVILVAYQLVPHVERGKTLLLTSDPALLGPATAALAVPSGDGLGTDCRTPTARRRLPVAQRSRRPASGPRLAGCACAASCGRREDLARW
jgi:hypothetical protein